MPGFLTHYLAGQTVLNSTEKNEYDIIKKYERLYNLGAQGPDIFFYYLPGIVRPRSRNIGGQMHKNDLGLFIARMGHLAKKSDDHRGLIFSYTAGLIMHYVVDVHAHPYVYASVYNKNASGIKNSADHRLFETAIDIAMLKLVSGQKPADYSQWELIKASHSQMRIAATAMSYCIQATYQRNVRPKDVYQAMRHMIQATRMLRSYRGRRKKWAGVVENLTIGQPLISSMIHDQENKQAIDYLNEKHRPWQAPWEEETFCTDSFIERYQCAIAEGLELIDALYQYVFEDMPLKAFGTKLGNRSLQTGAPCQLKIWQ